MKISTLWIIIIALVFAFITPITLIIALKEYKKQLKIITIILTIIYSIILLIGITFSISITKTYTQIKLNYTGLWFDTSKIIWIDLSLGNAIINLIMLMPYAFTIYVFCEKKYLLKCIIFGAIIGFIIELAQLILPIARNVEITDIIFNTISVLLGGLLSKLIFDIIFRYKRDINPAF